MERGQSFVFAMKPDHWVAGNPGFLLLLLNTSLVVINLIRTQGLIMDETVDLLGTLRPSGPKGRGYVFTWVS